MGSTGSARAFDCFERAFCVPAEDIELPLTGYAEAPWADFLLNPRRLRGSDFLMRWSQGVWSEHRLVEAVNASGEFYALPYGPSSVAPDGVREHELYFERLEAAGLDDAKRPDLLVYRAEDRSELEAIVARLGGQAELPFRAESDPLMVELVSRSVAAVECENSLWKAQSMPGYGKELRPMKRLGGKLGLPKNVVLPTIILKEEDRSPLRSWQTRWAKAIHIWHVFYDLAFGISFGEAEELIAEGLILPRDQTYQAPGGATTRKRIFQIYYQHAYLVGNSVEEPKLSARSIEDKNGHILPYVAFEGGRLRMAETCLRLLRGLS